MAPKKSEKTAPPPHKVRGSIVSSASFLNPAPPHKEWGSLTPKKARSLISKPGIIVMAWCFLPSPRVIFLDTSRPIHFPVSKDRPWLPC